MIWLVSYPRSGNTFFRNILFDVYGISSSSYHNETDRILDKNFANYPVIKTHLLPHQIPRDLKDAKVVYLVRDGRDALVSMAHQRKDIVEPNSDYYINLLEVVLAPRGSHFGGWSHHVEQWTKKAAIVIRFEDLITNPIKEVEKLRSIIELPSPNLDKLPTFDSQKFGTPKYTSEKAKELTKVFFRRGKTGSWKDEMPADLHQLYWQLHGITMKKYNYTDGMIELNISQPRKYKILIDATKLLEKQTDGIKRYTEELLAVLHLFEKELTSQWQIDLYIGKGEILNSDNQFVKPASFSFKLADKIHSILEVLKSLKIIPLTWLKNLVLYFPILIAQYFKYRTIYIPSSSRLKNYDLVHILLPQHLNFYKKSKTPTLVTVHDLTHKHFSQYHENRNINLTESGMQLLSKLNAKVIAVSNATKEDIAKSYPRLKENITTILEAANRDKFFINKNPNLLRQVREKYKFPDLPYFLCLNTIEPRKNVSSVVKAYLQLTKELDIYIALLVCGKKGWLYDDIIKIEETKNRNIYFTGYIEEADLSVIYSNAISLCYLSYYEGFGLPPLEAMTCGVPPIVGDNSSMPEIVQDGGIAVVPNDIEAIKNAMKRLATDDTYRSTLAQKAIQRSYQFSWLKTGFETLKVYEKILQ